MVWIWGLTLMYIHTFNSSEPKMLFVHPVWKIDDYNNNNFAIISSQTMQYGWNGLKWLNVNACIWVVVLPKKSISTQQIRIWKDFLFGWIQKISSGSLHASCAWYIIHVARFQNSLVKIFVLFACIVWTEIELKKKSTKTQT